ncbi:MAG: ferredoxin [Pirellulaceae bacterium]|nr:MAG: ferredoxin [Pirellulaceae bacterium]
MTESRPGLDQGKESETVTIWVNGRMVRVPAGTVLASALLHLGILYTARSVSGQLRGPLCGMGICFECRATVNGQPLMRTCQLVCHEGLRVEIAQADQEAQA